MNTKNRIEKLEAKAQSKQASKEPIDIYLVPFDDSTMKPVFLKPLTKGSNGEQVLKIRA